MIKHLLICILFSSPFVYAQQDRIVFKPRLRQGVSYSMKHTINQTRIRKKGWFKSQEENKSWEWQMDFEVLDDTIDGEYLMQLDLKSKDGKKIQGKLLAGNDGSIKSWQGKKDVENPELKMLVGLLFLSFDAKRPVYLRKRWQFRDKWLCKNQLPLPELGILDLKTKATFHRWQTKQKYGEETKSYGTSIWELFWRRKLPASPIIHADISLKGRALAFKSQQEGLEFINGTLEGAHFYEPKLGLPYENKLNLSLTFNEAEGKRLYVKQQIRSRVLSISASQKAVDPPQKK